MTFLEQLQQSAGLLGQQIQNVEPFGVYTPTESDYIQGVAQNRFVGNQFQMPNLGQSVHGGTQYTGMGTGMGLKRRREREEKRKEHNTIE